jgi:uncharacterized phiE125 gp8 family phage protein
MSYKVSTKLLTETIAPVIEPVGLQEMKVHCRCEDTNDSDTILGVMITAARQFVEKQYQISLVQRSYRADLWAFYSVIHLPLPPLSSVTSIKYYTDDSPQVLTTLDSTAYRHDLGRSMIYRDTSVTLPTASVRHDAVQITFVAGREPSTDSPQDLAGNVPEAIKSAIKLQAADLFENRETNTQLRMQELPTTKMLLAPWREY